jgi:hypothetical protein
MLLLLFWLSHYSASHSSHVTLVHGSVCWHKCFVCVTNWRLRNNKDLIGLLPGVHRNQSHMHVIQSVKNLYSIFLKTRYGSKQKWPPLTYFISSQPPFLKWIVLLPPVHVFFFPIWYYFCSFTRHSACTRMYIELVCKCSPVYCEATFSHFKPEVIPHTT